MTRRRRGRGWGLALAAALLVAGGGARAAAEARARYGGTATGGLTSAPIALEPLTARSHAELTVVAMLFDALYRVDDAGAVVPQLAAAMPTVGKTGEIEIPVRAGVHFHDGQVLTAKDAVRSLRRLQATEAGAYLLAGVRKLSASGDRIVVHTDREATDLAVALASPASSITSGAKGSVGTGPFRLGAVSARTRSLALLAFDEHFQGRPYLDRLELTWFQREGDEARLYEAGRSHWSYRGAIAFAGHQPKYPTVEIEGPPVVVSYLGFGSKLRAAPPAVRKALSLAIGRTGLAAGLSGDRVVPTVTPVLPQLGGRQASKAELAGSPREAAAGLLAANDAYAAKLARGEETLELLIDETRLDDRVVADKIIAALYRAGLSVHIKVVSAAEFRSRTERGAVDLYVGQLVGLTPLAIDAYATAFEAGGDATLSRARAAATLDLERASLAFEASLPIAPLLLSAPRVHHRRSVRGLSFDALGLPTLADGFISSDNDRP